MRAVAVTGERGAQALTVGSAPMPVPGPGTFLIEVRASALNHADLYQRDGDWPAPPGAPGTLGVEAAGIVVSADPDGRFERGDRVMALLDGGGYAEYATVDGGLAVGIPQGTTFIEAAALPEALIVGHSNLVEIGGVGPGSRVLIHGGSSGMGSMMIQMAADLGALVATTTGSPSKAGRLMELGARRVLERQPQAWATAVAGEFADGFDTIVDIGGAGTLQANLALLRDGGTLILMGILGGTVGEIDIDPILLKRLKIRGTILRPIPIEEKRALAARAYARWLPRVRAGALRPVVDSVHALDEVRAAHLRLESGQHLGKVVLDVDAGGGVHAAPLCSVSR